MKKLIIVSLAMFLTNFSLANEIVQRHVVKKGETLSSLATKYNTSIEQLKKWNNISNNKIYPGQNIIVKKYETKQRNDDTYVVKKGDTLSSISEKTKISVEKLKSYNNLESDKLYPGQKLVLKKDVQTANNRPIHSSTEQSNVYYVKKGDTLSSISKKTGLSIDEIKKINNLSDNKLSVGQKLILYQEKKILETETQQVFVLSKKEEIENDNNDDIADLPSKIVINKYHKIKKGETLAS
ncbi:MAG: LysM peptidoglycan-binding domain-containing protein, partial [Candidatus Omnitrophica bacterium]|nr:LysM peptidoglycan-binding domain-containing protein [Candidatus Omnitrophota bacterium]